MPESRNRPGHTFQEPSAIPAKQRVKGRVIWAILFAVFGSIVAYFAAGDKYIIIVLVAIAAAAVGYFAGKSMERDASHKQD